MTIEEKVNRLEEKLATTIELLKFVAYMDSGLSKDDTDWLISRVKELLEDD